MDLPTSRSQQRYDDLVAVSSSVLVGLDFDGVLSPIVDDPTRAVIHPDGPEVLAGLLPVIGSVAVITGRPARQAVDLGGLEGVADAAAVKAASARFVVLGQYGNERWDAATGEFTSPPEPAGLTHFRAQLPELLAQADAAGAFVEDKGIAVAVHTRRLPDPTGSFDRLLPRVRAAAEAAGLGVEPGRLVIEVRAPGMDKGQALRGMVTEVGAGGIVYAGDDLGDIPAFRAVAELRDGGLPGFLVCSGSAEQRALVDLADLVVDGPTGVVDFLRELTRDARAAG